MNDTSPQGALELEALVVKAGQRVLLGPLDLKVAPGKCLAILGPNGAGKTTLFRALLGLYPQYEGQIRWDGAPLSKITGRRRAATVAWLPQHSAIREAVPAIDFVKAARFRFDESRAAALSASRKALQLVGAAGLENQPVTTLSGGEMQRVQMAALVAQDARTFLLDEPANHLDPARQLSFYRLIRKQRDSGRGVLCITHDINLLTELVGEGNEAEVEVLGLKEGRPMFRMAFGDPKFTAALEDLFDLRFEQILRDGRSYFLPRSEEPT